LYQFDKNDGGPAALPAKTSFEVELRARALQKKVFRFAAAATHRTPSAIFE
jgi:hypothetical protein